MLPMFTTVAEVETFVRLVDGRARAVPLLEHRLAADRVVDLVRIGRACDDSQPVPTNLIYAQYARLNATGALVSRAFFGPDPATLDVAAEVRACRDRMAWWRGRSAAELAAARTRFVARVGTCPTW
jgi:hypothetical protein